MDVINMLRLFSPAKELKVSSPEEKKSTPFHRLPHIPIQVAAEDLDENGNLIVTHRKEIVKIIEDIVAGTSKHARQRDAGRLTKKRLAKILGEKPTCGAMFKKNNKTGKPDIYRLYKGEKHTFIDPRTGKKKTAGRLAGKGGNANVKIMQHDNYEWHVDKMEVLEVGNTVEEKEADISIDCEMKCSIDKEFKITQEMGFAEERIVRQSPSKSEEKEPVYQHETIMKWLAEKDLHDYFYKDNPPPLFIFEIILQMIDCVIQFHKKGYIHCDIKLENFLKSLMNVVLIDFGHARLKTAGETNFEKELATKFHYGTIGYIDPALLKDDVIISEKTDIYALGITIAILLDLVAKESQSQLEKTVSERVWQRLTEKDRETKITDTDFLRLGGLKLCDKSSDEFKQNETIADIRDRRRIYNFVDKIMGKLDDRPNLDEIRIFFEAQYKKMLSKTKTDVCLININEFLAASPERRQQFFASASKHTMTCIVESSEHTIKEYLDVTRAFAAKQIFFGKNVVACHKDMQNLGANLEMSMKDAEPGKKFSYTFLTDQLLSSAKKKILEQEKIQYERLKQPVRYTRSSAVLFSARAKTVKEAMTGRRVKASLT